MPLELDSIASQRLCTWSTCLSTNAESTLLHAPFVLDFCTGFLDWMILAGEVDLLVRGKVCLVQRGRWYFYE